MFNDDANRQQNPNQNQGQGGGTYASQGQSSYAGQNQGSFVRRPIPNPKYSSGGDNKPSYDRPSYQQGGQSQGGYSSGGYSGGGQSSYSRPYQRRDAGSTGSNYGSGYKSGGYSNNRNNQYGGTNDRLIRQNDIIIKLLKDIRDRLPIPPGVQQDTSDNYGSDGSYGGSYASSNSYSAPANSDGGDQVAASGSGEAQGPHGEENGYNS